MGISAFREQIGSEKEVLAMPRMPKYLKEELAFFLDERGRKKYNELCRKCERSCKQRFILSKTVFQCVLCRGTIAGTPEKNNPNIVGAEMIGNGNAAKLDIRE